jgi:hypothetical protein
MNAYERVQQSVWDGLFDDQKKLSLLLAYLQLHNNCGLHPDDYLTTGGGYQGWHVLLVHKVLTEIKDIPDDVKYPCWLMGVSAISVPHLLDFHGDDETDEMTNHVEKLGEFIEDMNCDDVEDTLQSLYAVLGFHADAYWAPEGVFEHLESMKTSLEWLKKFK